MAEETRVCPTCGKKALKVDTGVMLTSYPPQFPMEWRCGCGWRESAGIVRGETEQESFMRVWQVANREGTP